MSPILPTVQVIGRRHEPAHYELRDFLTRTAQPHQWLEAGSLEADELVERLGLRDPPLPVVVNGSEVIQAATVVALAHAWHTRSTPARSHYELAIIGAGPAGLAAAVYAASDGLSTLLIERDVPGGQASYTSLIENFFGFPDGIGGAELARRAGRQAERFGAELLLLHGVESGRLTDADGVRLGLAGGAAVTATVAIAAPGMEWRRLDVPGIDELRGRGVYYGAGRSEAARRTGDEVVVVGAGNSAGQAVLDLGNAGAKVTMVIRGDRLGSTMSAYLVDRIAEHPLIDVRFRTEVVGVEAHDGHLATVTLAGADGVTETRPTVALFLCIGGTPRTAWADAVGVRTDAAGFVMTGPDLLDAGRRPEGWPLQRDPLTLETSVPGFFAAGDVRHGSTKRVAGAVGEGAMAVALAHRRLAELDAPSGDARSAGRRVSREGANATR